MTVKKKSVAKKKTVTKVIPASIPLRDFPELPTFCRYINENTTEIHCSGPEARNINAVLGIVARAQRKAK